MFSHEDIVENLSEAVVAIDAKTSIAAFNQAAEKLTGVSRSAVLGRPLREVFGKNPRLAEMLEKTLAEGRLFAEYEETLVRRFPPPLPVGITTSQIFSVQGEVQGAVALIKDLSGIKSLEAGSLRKERLAYIGTFAANLAHELKNPLSGMRGAAQLLDRKVRDEKLKDYTSVIMREADRLNAILNDMLDFARPAKLNKKECNIHKVLDSVVLILSEGAPAETFGREYDPSLPPLFADEGSITQVFLNLVKNAKESLGKNGAIRLITRMPAESYTVEPGGRGGRMAAIEIRDNGCGIRPEDMENIFTPFFTTKPKGSGLGMAISLKIIKEHSGHLNLESTLGAGTSVTVYLPTAQYGAGGDRHDEPGR